MAITTEFLPWQANTTSLEIIKEFIYTYISSDEIDILDEFPFLSESYPLTKPILVLEDMNGRNYSVGIGKNVGDGSKGTFKNLSFMASWVVNDVVGGASRLRLLSDTLQYIFESKSSELSVVGLKKAMCSQMRTIQKTNYGGFWGGRHMISAKVLVWYD